MRKHLILLFVTLTLPSCSPEFKKHYLSSELVGKLILEDKPVYNATIVRSSKSSWYDKEPVIDSVKTDERGVFFLKKRIKYATFTLLHQPVIEQILTIKINNKECEVINLNKGSYKKNGEFNPMYENLEERINLYLKDNKLNLDIFLRKQDTISW